MMLMSSVAGFSFGAMAEKGKAHGQAKQEMREYDKHHGRDQGRALLTFYDDDRVIIRNYLHDNYARNCPLGLAKKNNGCLPPGQAKKMYRVGYPLEVAWNPMPDVLLDRLHPAPHGYRYVMVDRDVLLIGEASKKVIDAITLLSALDN
ncbi:MAG: hypothetical protein AB7F82_01100 [Alphaproteobacteria bacterium]